MVETQFQRPIKSIQTDNAKEFLTFTNFLQTHGILHRRICPHTHEQNGSIERKHRHITATGLTLLAHASLPTSFWEEAFHTAVYLINLLPTPTLNYSSPFQKLYAKPPDYTSLRPFGCACFPLLRPYSHRKLDFRSEKCTFLGYSDHYRGYKCLAKSGKLFMSRHVIFDEFSFPSSELASTFTPSQPTPHRTSIPNIPLISSLNAPHAYAPNPPSPIILPAATNLDRSTTLATEAPHVSPAPAPASPSVAAAVSVSPSGPAPTNQPMATVHEIPSHTSRRASVLPPAAAAAQHASAIDNAHPMVTRGKNGIFKPKAFTASVEPRSTKQALSDPQWLQAMNDEFQALMKNNTWTLVPLPAGRAAIGSKWVFRVKYNPDGSINKYKARLVAKGFHQQEGFDFHETFSPVVKPTTVRVVLTIATSKRWPIHQVDFNNAFLNGDLQESVYMTQPEGFVAGDKSLVCKLNKALYGLKQAPRAWFAKLQHTLHSLGFSSAKSDSSLFIRSTARDLLYVLVYVDDVIITGSSSSAITHLISSLHATFSLKDLGTLHYFLGIEAKPLPLGGLHLSQTKYISDLLLKANLLDCNPSPTPMTSGLRLSKHGDDIFEDAPLYRSIVGALQYATITRPDIAFCVNKVCQFMHRPLLSHWQAVKRILRYLQGTLHHGLLLQPCPSLNLFAFCDADWGSDPDDRRSTTGFGIYLGGNLVSWMSKKQASVSRSSTEGEYRSLAATVSELIWLKSLLLELHLPVSSAPAIYCDNLSAVMMTANPILHHRSKHFELDLHFVRENVLNKTIVVSHIPSHEQAADVLTKAVSSSQFPYLRSKLRVGDFPSLSLRGGVRE